jgi:hypothetical protein
MAGGADVSVSELLLLLLVGGACRLANTASEGNTFSDSCLEVEPRALSFALVHFFLKERGITVVNDFCNLGGKISPEGV